MPLIAKWVVSDPTYAKYAGKDATQIVQFIQGRLIYPFGKWLSGNTRYLVAIPYFLVIAVFIKYLLKKSKPYRKAFLISSASVFLLLFIFPDLLLVFENNQPSKSHGSVANGYIENAKRMNYRGNNFKTYSFFCYLAGRTFVHDDLRQTILDAYKSCEETCPGLTFIIGEIGTKKGGQFLPHRTHRNGMSVDFMTPLLKNEIHYRSHHIFNLWGYRYEFDNRGQNGNVEIDYESMARHLLALEAAAKQNGLIIQKVIFDPALRPFLLKTPTGKKLKHLPFTKNRVVVRHDDHYHIDFKVKA